MKKIIIIIILVILLGLIAAIGTYQVLTMPVSKNNENNEVEEEIEVEIPMGSGANKIAKILKDKDLIKSELAFKVYVKIHKISNFKAGTYYLKKSMNLKEIAEMLQTGIMFDQNEITLTYIEGKPMWWLAKTIANKTNNTEDDVYAVLKDEEYIDSLINKYWFITDEIKNENIYYSLEGYLFPDTYSIANKDTKVEEIFEKMLDRMEEILEPYRQEVKESKYSVHEILTLASIIETEGMNNSDRKNVSSVFYNRLNAGMSLGSDVTTYYSVQVDMGERDLFQKEIETYNPYNTRGPNMEGKLPVGPISSAGKASIEAAVEPNETDYLFFVADKNGKLYFTKTNAEHMQIINELKANGQWFEY